MTLTYVYADQTAVLGPLATYAEPHAYDLCEEHSGRLSAPRGWDVVRLASDVGSSAPSDDDLLALADAVREVGSRQPALSPELEQIGPGSPHASNSGDSGGSRPPRRRGHLRVLEQPVDDAADDAAEERDPGSDGGDTGRA